MSIVDALAESVGAPDDLALVGKVERWSYGELDQQVDRRCAALRGQGVESGTVVPVVTYPDAAGVVELLALWRLGAVPAPLNPKLTEAELDSARANLEGALTPGGTQVVLWTSGTAGHPRGVALSWANLSASVEGVRERLSLGPTDVWLASLSSAHVGGLVLILRSIVLGGCLVAVGPFDVATTSDALDGEGLPENAKPPTHLSLVPTQLLRLLDHRGGHPVPPQLKCALIGGAHAPTSLVARAHTARWPIALTYGATEMASQIATAAPARTRLKPGTVGPPIEGVELRVAPDSELLVRGATQALGYVGGESESLSDPEGWYHTGDIGRLDDEGDLWITGRRIDRIVSGGVTVDAVEIEEALRAHPTVIDACVVGIPDDEWGERVAAWVEPVIGEFDLEEIELHVQDVLSGTKRPRAWHVSPDLPRNPNGKADRRRVRAVLGSEQGDSERA